MTIHWKVYSTYNSINVEWLDNIPNHWKVKALRRILLNGTDGIKIGPFGSQLKLEYMKDSGYRVYGQEHVIYRDFSIGSKYIDAVKYDELKGYSIKPGDIVVTMMGTTGRCQVVPEGIEPGIMDSHLIRIRVNESEMIPRFVALLINDAHYVREQINALGKGAIMSGLNSSIIKTLRLVIPPLCEQNTILSFIDRQTSKIDALITKKERLIELLQEKRVALISHAVTKGLDPTVPVKDSGVEWLREIPTHWGITKLKRHFTVQLGKMLSPTASTPDDTLEPYLRAANIQWDGVDVSDIKEMWFSPSEKEKYSLKYGDLLVSEGGDAGRSALWKSELPACYIQNAINRVRSKNSKNGYSTKFLYYWLFVLKQSGYIDIICSKATISHLTAEKLKEIPIIALPVNEQDLIVIFLEEKTAKLNKICQKIKNAINKLKEYRTALISAAVTGKIDVRGETL